MMMIERKVLVKMHEMKGAGLPATTKKWSMENDQEM
jgi:hypothetical protein